MTDGASGDTEREGTKKQKSRGWAFQFSSSSPWKDGRTVEVTKTFSFLSLSLFFEPEFYLFIMDLNEAICG